MDPHTRICHDKDLQFIYQIDSEILGTSNYAAQDMLEHLGLRLQRSFSMKLQPLHYSPETKISDWNLYRHIW
jgi:hypothetical protein